MLANSNAIVSPRTDRMNVKPTLNLLIRGLSISLCLQSSLTILTYGSISCRFSSQNHAGGQKISKLSPLRKPNVSCGSLFAVHSTVPSALRSGQPFVEGKNFEIHNFRTGRLPLGQSERGSSRRSRFLRLLGWA